MDDILQMISRGAEQLLGRATGPLHLRLVIMPAVVTLLAIRAGLKDAHERQPPFLWGIITDPCHRRERVCSAWQDISRVIFVALVADTVYQVLVLQAFYVVQLLIVVAICAVLPYVLIRGVTNSAARSFRRICGSAASTNGSSTSSVDAGAASVRNARGTDS